MSVSHHATLADDHSGPRPTNSQNANQYEPNSGRHPRRFSHSGPPNLVRMRILTSSTSINFGPISAELSGISSLGGYVDRKWTEGMKIGRVRTKSLDLAQHLRKSGRSRWRNRELFDSNSTNIAWAKTFTGQTFRCRPSLGKLFDLPERSSAPSPALKRKPNHVRTLLPTDGATFGPSPPTRHIQSRYTRKARGQAPNPLLMCVCVCS